MLIRKMRGVSSGLRGAGMLPGLVLLLACLASWLPAQAQAQAQAQAGDLQLKYLGAAGWEIRHGDVVVLVDPYVSRIPRDRYGGRNLGPDDDYLLSNSDPRRVDEVVTRADYILVQHAHPDHFLDIPYIAKKTGAKVVASETANNLLRAYGVPDEQLYTVQGGEDYAFGDLSLRVVPALHSALSGKQYFNATRYTEPPSTPLKGGAFIEGGSLMFLVRLGGREVLTMGSMNFVENEVRGLKPDILLAGAGLARTEIHRYTERLLAATGFPRIVIPTHWDDFFVPYDDQAAQVKARAEKADVFVEEARAASPGSRIIVPTHLVPIVISD